MHPFPLDDLLLRFAPQMQVVSDKQALSKKLTRRVLRRLHAAADGESIKPHALIATTLNTKVAWLQLKEDVSSVGDLEYHSPELSAAFAELLEVDAVLEAIEILCATFAESREHELRRIVLSFAVDDEGASRIEEMTDRVEDVRAVVENHLHLAELRGAVVMLRSQVLEKVLGYLG